MAVSFAITLADALLALSLTLRQLPLVARAPPVSVVTEDSMEVRIAMGALDVNFALVPSTKNLTVDDTAINPSPVTSFTT